IGRGAGRGKGGKLGGGRLLKKKKKKGNGTVQVTERDDRWGDRKSYKVMGSQGCREGVEGTAGMPRRSRHKADVVCDDSGEVDATSQMILKIAEARHVGLLCVDSYFMGGCLKCRGGRCITAMESTSRIVEISRIVPLFFFFSSRRRHTRLVSDWSSDVCSSD